jgi:hypothetical protein
VGKNSCMALVVEVGSGKAVSVAGRNVGVLEGDVSTISGVADEPGIGADIDEVGVADIGDWIMGTAVVGTDAGAHDANNNESNRFFARKTGILVMGWM